MEKKIALSVPQFKNMGIQPKAESEINPTLVHLVQAESFTGGAEKT
jgi:hypothetical protein